MRLNCFHCHRKVEISAQQLGGRVACPHCGGAIRLPDADADHNQGTVDGVSSSGGSWLSSSISGLTSVVFHMGLALLFAVMSCDYQPEGSGQAGEEVFIAELPFESLSEHSDVELDAAEAIRSASESMDETLEVVSPIEDIDGELSLDVSLADLAPSGAAGGTPSIGMISGGGGALGEGASFMGLNATGTRFCIIADHSGSMDGPKLEYVKKEIQATLSTMGSQSRFQIVFFSSDALPYPQTGWRHPRRDRAAVSTWLNGIKATGGTYPSPAFRAAFSFSPRPDAIFFMTDGQFPEQVVNDIASLNARGGRRVVVHTISFMDASTEEQMRQIARESGGRYRHVSGF